MSTQSIGEYRPIGIRAKLAIMSVGASTFLRLVTLALLPTSLALEAQLAPDAPLDSSTVATAMLVGLIALADAFAFLVATVLFSVWFYRAGRNVTSFVGPYMRYGAGWAVASFYIPILCLFAPLTAMKDFWNACHLTVDVTAPQAMAKAKTPGVLVVWWTCWIGSSLASLGARGAAKMPSATTGAAVFQGVSAVLLCISGVACILIIKRLTRAQTELFEKAAAEPEPLPVLRRADAA